ncbi:ABC transporter G family member 21 [Impatiens glandulifera]|uniref:ABC transporter G family member 21 n=1 Tax=Impatiens glandulifera TaxID=253017 RepID=UPI001FB04E93|nr:ABC transporter G family member 21 [Impatiens glandulifera]
MAPPNSHSTISSPIQPNHHPTDNIGTCFIHANPISPLPKTTNLNLDHPILKASLRPITLKFQDVAYTINLSASPKSTKTVLNGVTGMVKPGELMAMLGPSGSGKTTLLTALSGRYLAGKISGTITYNERPFTGSMKRKIGFVSQDDVLYPHLTVLETLTYSALLRLPGKLTNNEKMEQVDFVINELGLGRCRNGVVGGPLLRGISGGERKRVSIGQEMLINPSLLFLDEPTSGLDSTTAGRIVATLKGLARGGRTVVMTVHQPSGRIYRTLDKVVVLSEGSPIYTGPARGVVDYFRSIGYCPGFEFINPAEFLLDLANGIVPDVRQEEYEHEEIDILENQHDHHHQDHTNSVKQFLLSSYKKSIYPSLKEEIRRSSLLPSTRPPPTRTGSNEEDNQFSTSWWTQFKVLSKRGLKERKHESYSGLRIFQVMSVSILSGLLWWHSDTSHIQDQVGLLFFFSIFWGFFPLFNAIFAFPSERPILSKERASRMYYLSSYYFARTVGDLPMELILPTIFVAVTYWMGGLKPSLSAFIMTLLVVLFNVLVSQGLGLALGAVLMDMKPASTLASVTMLVFLLAGGYYIQRIPKFMSWLKFVSFSHYCYKLLVGVQYSGNEVYECAGPDGLMKWCRVWDFPAIKYLGIENMMWDVAALAVMLFGYRLLAYLALRFGPTH